MRTGFGGNPALKKTFSVQSGEDVRRGGGWTKNWTFRAEVVGVLAKSNAQSGFLGQATQETKTHNIVCNGAPVAKTGERLVLGNRYFYVLSVENPGDLNRTHYYEVIERGS